MITFSDPSLYVKGTCNVIVSDPATGKIDFQSNKVNTNQFNTTCDLGEIRAGLGNPIAIQIPQNCAVNLNLTTADFSLASRALQLGTTTYYNAIAPVCETIEAVSTSLTVTKTPAPMPGFSKAYCWITTVGAENPIGTAGVAYTIDPDTLVIDNFVADVGTTYQVHYSWQNASAEGLTVYSMFAPAVKHVIAQLGVYSTDGTSNSTQGSLIGWLYYIIPRMQFAGNASVSGDQTTPATSELSGTALMYNPAVAEGVCQDCATSEMAYMVFVPADGALSAVKGLVIVGGEITVETGSTMQTPVKYLMPDNSLIQPHYSDLSYTVTDTNIATASNTGLITPVTTGDTEITVTLADPALSVVANLSVVSA